MSIELAILLPAFMMLVVLAIFFGRQATAQNSVDLAAHDAARAASVARTDDSGFTAAQNAAAATLDPSQGLCTSFTVVEGKPDGFLLPAGQPASVTYTVSCTISYTSLALIFVPNSSVTLHSTFTSPLDVYRGRS